MNLGQVVLLLAMLIGPIVSRGEGPGGVAPDPLVENLHRVLAALDALKQPLPESARAKLDRAMALPDPAARSAAIQAAIDPECLLTVAIGPESRVSIGPVRPVLEQHGWRTFLIRVENPSGSTPELHLRPSRSYPRRFDLADAPAALLPARLTGRPVEYRLGRISPRRVGRYPLELGVHLSEGAQARDVETRLDVILSSIVHSTLIPDVPIPGLSNSMAVAEAEADRLDPFWRLADLEANREVYPPERNGAIRVLEVRKLLPPEAPELKAIQGLAKLVLPAIAEPARRLSPKLAEDLRQKFEPLRALVIQARTIERFASGRFPRDLSRNYYLDAPPEVAVVRDLATALYLDTLLLADHCEPDAALGSCRAMLAVGRSVGDDSNGLGQSVRLGTQQNAANLIERILAQGEPTDEALTRTQALLADEADQSLFLHFIRGERANVDIAINRVALGEVDPKILTGVNDYDFPPGGGENAALYRETQAFALLITTRMVEIAKRPTPVQGWMIADVESRFFVPKHFSLLAYPRMRRWILAWHLLDINFRVEALSLRNRTRLRCAVLAMALERTRRVTGHWPKPGDSPAPFLPDGLPVDPYTGKPLRWKAIDTGLVVYSVGPDRADDGGNLDTKTWYAPGTDIGCRLWDVSRRGQPPAKEPAP